MQRIARQLSLWLLGIALTLSALADDVAIDWPTFQGNHARTGSCDYPAIKTPTIAWSTRVGIMGYLNCPVIDGDTVFVTSSGDTHNVPDDRDGVYALSLTTGEVLWHYRTNADACGISIDRRFVYAGDDGGRLQAIDRVTGQRVWSRDFDGSVFAQPLLIDDLVVIGDGAGSVFACDTNTGDIRWLFDGRGPIRGGLSSDGTNLFAVFLSGRVVCLAANGQAKWTAEIRDALFDSIEAYPAPTIFDGQVYLAYARDTTYDLPAVVSYTTKGRLGFANRTKNFRRADGRSFGNLRSSPAIYKDWLVYAEPYGNEMAWTDRATGRFVDADRIGLPMFPQWASPVIAGDVVYMARQDGSLYAMDMTRDDRLCWSVFLGKQAEASVEDTEKVLRDAGQAQWDTTRGDAIYATPAIARDGTVVVGSGEGWLYCIREK
jgi:outer membrane protein assembly factor BamB